MPQIIKDTVAEAEWGTHFCHFFKTRQDLLDILVPYFKAGLEKNEFCMWITAEPLDKKAAEEALKKAVKNFEGCRKKGQIEILDYSEWYTKGGKFDSRRVLNGWIEKLKKARAKGFSGLRLSGNTFWLEKEGWNDFKDYERQVNEVIGKYRIKALCSYSLEKCNGEEVLDVVKNHQFAIARKHGMWEMIESQPQAESRKRIEKLASFPQLNPNPVVEADFSGKITYANPAAQALLAKVGKNELKALIKSLQDVREKLRHGHTVQREMKAAEKWYLVTLSSPEEGKVRAYSFDITERKAAEEQLMKAKQEWENTFDSVPDLIAIIDSRHRIVRANKAMAERLGKSAGQCTGLDCFKCVHKLGKPPNFCPHSQTLKDKKEHFAELHEERLGGDFLVSTTPIFGADGKVEASVHVARDITERKRLEQEAKKELKERQAILDSVPAMVFYKDRNNRFVHVNKMFEKIMGLPKKRLEGTSLFEIYPKQQAEAFWNDDKKVMKSGKPKRGIIEPMQTPEGNRLVQTDKIPFFDENGDINGVIGFAVDITERERARQRLQTMNRVLNALSESNRAMALAKNEKKYLNEVCRIIVKDCGHKLVWIGLLQDDARKTVLPVAQAGFEKGYLKKIDINLSDPERRRGPTGQAMLSGKPKGCNDMLNDQKFAPWRNAALKRGYQSSIVFPLVANGKTFGALNIYSSKAFGFPKIEAKMLGKLANDLAQGITNLRIKTEKEKAENELEKSREDLNHAQSVARIGSWRLEVQKNELLWSDENYRLFGVPKGIPLTYETFLSRIHPEDRDFVDRKWKAGMRGEHYDIEHRIMANGKVKWVREKAELEFDNKGKLLGGFGTTQDITELKETEKALNESEEKYHSLFENSPIPLIEEDFSEVKKELAKEKFGKNEGIESMLAKNPQIVSRLADKIRVTSVNNSALEFFKARDLAEFSSKFWQIFRKKTLKGFREEITGFLKKNKAYKCDSFATTLEGKAKNIELCVNIAPGFEESWKKVIASTVDITARKRLEERQRTEYERLKKVNELKSSILRDVSHELRHPISVIRMATDLIDSKACRTSNCGESEKLKKYIDMIRRNSTMFEKELSSVMELSKLQAMEKISMKKTALDKIVKNAIAYKAELAREKGIRIVQKIPKGTSLVANSELLERLVRNLVSNAVKFTEKGSVKVSCKESGGKLFIEVKDTGIGIKQDDLKTIFLPFKKIDESSEGLGVGLAICRKVAELHNGAISVKSKLGKGSTFTAVLQKE